jgi:hypothetical protein
MMTGKPEDVQLYRNDFAKIDICRRRLNAGGRDMHNASDSPTTTIPQTNPYTGWPIDIANCTEKTMVEQGISVTHINPCHPNNPSGPCLRSRTSFAFLQGNGAGGVRLDRSYTRAAPE